MSTKSKRSLVSEEEARRAVEARAYQIWETEGYRDGTQDDNWYRAEREHLATSGVESQNSSEGGTTQTRTVGSGN